MTSRLSTNSTLSRSASQVLPEKRPVDLFEDTDCKGDVECAISQADKDSLNHMFSFLDASDIARFCSASKPSCLSVAKHKLDAVHDVAWIDGSGHYHVQHITSAQKAQASKNLFNMTCVRVANKTEFLLVPRTSPTFSWARFVSKPMRETRSKGYWKVLRSELKPNTKYASIYDLDLINSLVTHKEIAPLLLDYTATDKPFKSSVKIYIHDTDTDDIREYEVLFWNGSDIGQCSAFQIRTCSSDKTTFYMHFESRLPRHLLWMWYDNNQAKYVPYTMGAEVDAQIECSFQANLSYNFPQHDACFNHVRLTALRKAFIERFGASGDEKTFLVRFAYGEDAERGRYVRSVEQLTVSDSTYCASESVFSRNVQRINLNKEGESIWIKNRSVADLRMKREPGKLHDV